jgi:hypothetical protein
LIGPFCPSPEFLVFYSVDARNSLKTSAVAVAPSELTYHAIAVGNVEFSIIGSGEMKDVTVECAPVWQGRRVLDSGLIARRETDGKWRLTNVPTTVGEALVRRDGQVLKIVPISLQPGVSVKTAISLP